MPPSSSWLIPLALFLLLGLFATVYLVKSRLPRELRAAGMRSLGTLPWSDFIQLALAVLNARGYERSFGGAGTEGEYLLEHHGQKWLLSSRHSRAWTPGSTAIAEFAAHLRHQGLQGGILAIPGRFPPAAFSVAKAHRVELLDGPGMWSELAPALSQEQHAQIESAARRRMRGQYALAWAAALAVAILAGVAWQSRVEGTRAPEPSGIGEAPPVPMTAPVAEGAQTPTQVPAPANDVVAAPLPEIAATSVIPVEERRKNIAQAAAALPNVRTAHWPTPSTLLVQVGNTTFDPHTLCPLLETDPELGTSRLQVQYPAGSEQSVRFLQCRQF